MRHLGLNVVVVLGQWARAAVPIDGGQDHDGAKEQDREARGSARRPGWLSSTPWTALLGPRAFCAQLGKTIPRQSRGRRDVKPAHGTPPLPFTSNVGKHPCRAVKHRWGLCQMRSFERASLVVDCGCFEAMRDRPGSGKAHGPAYA
jgi:hypothetical protein